MYYANKQKRQKLSDLSQKVFGKRSKWQYFVKERGLSIDSIEQQMLILEKQIDEQLKEMQNDPTKRPIIQTRKPNRAARRKYLLARGRETRRRQAKPSVAPAGSINGNSQSARSRSQKV
jgi:hypothetical protein